MTSRYGSQLTWTSYNLPKQINATGSACSGDCDTFTYGPDRQRIKQVVKTGGTTKEIYYIGPHFEVEETAGITTYRSNVFANGHAVYSQIEVDSPTPNVEAYFVLHDYQGSVTDLYRAVGGSSNTIATAFDAWGARRNTNWTPDPSGARYADTHWLERGYTGHEHVDNVRLIHMNGRVQEPAVARMLSPDPFLGNLADPQSLNPYSYARNNPVSYVDPSGFFLGRIGKFFSRAIQGAGHFLRRTVRKYGRQIVAAIAAYYTCHLSAHWSHWVFGG